MEQSHSKVNTKLSSFNTSIESILGSACELWGQRLGSDLERIYLDFFIRCKENVTSLIVYFELRRKQLQLNIKYNMLKYLLKLKSFENCI